MPDNQQHQQERELMEKLKTILLQEDRQQLMRIQTLLENQGLLAEKVSPIIEEHIHYLKNNYPEEFRKVVDVQIEKKLKDSQQELLDVIYPTLGAMIKKYIAHQLQMLKDNIDFQIRNTFSKAGIFGRVKSVIFGIDHSEMLLSNASKPTIEEVYVIQRDSGLLLGIGSRSETMDKDAIAGMLTAIKAFVEDAFQREKEELETIEYGSYKIMIQNYYSYYIAFAVTGALSAIDKEQIEVKAATFAQKELVDLKKMNENEQKQHISSRLEQYFIEGRELVVRR